MVIRRPQLWCSHEPRVFFLWSCSNIHIPTHSRRCGFFAAGLMRNLWTPKTDPRSNVHSSSVPNWFVHAIQSRSGHDDVIKWKHFPRYWPFVRGIHRLPVNSPHKGQWRGALMFSLICVWINVWVNNREADDLRRHRAHYDVIVMGRELTCRAPFTNMD